MDFSIPAGAPQDPTLGPIVPIAFLRKVALTNFDLRNEDDQAIPLLTKEQNARVSAAALLQLAYFARPELMDRFIDEYVPELVRASESDADTRELAWSRIFMPKTSVGAHLSSRPEFVALARDLSRYFVAYAVAEAAPYQRRVLKFRYEAPHTSGRRGPRVLFGWRPMPYRTGELAIAHSASYHLELEAPEDTEFTYAVLVSAGRGDFALDAARVPSRRVHMQAGVRGRGAAGEAWFGIRARRPGMLRASLFVAFFSAVVLLFIRLRLGSFEEASIGETGAPHPSSGSDAVAALLAALPAILATFVVRPGEHAVLGRVLFGVRLLLVTAAGISFFSALSLFAGLSSSSLKAVWSIAVAIEILLSAALALSFILPRPVRRRSTLKP